MQAPVTVLQANTKRDMGKKAQMGNIMAGKVRVLRIKGYLLMLVWKGVIACELTSWIPTRLRAN